MNSGNQVSMCRPSSRLPGNTLELTKCLMTGTTTAVCWRQGMRQACPLLLEPMTYSDIMLTWWFCDFVKPLFCTKFCFYLIFQHVSMDFCSLLPLISGNGPRLGVASILCPGGLRSGSSQKRARERWRPGVLALTPQKHQKHEHPLAVSRKTEVSHFEELSFIRQVHVYILQTVHCQYTAVYTAVTILIYYAAYIFCIILCAVSWIVDTYFMYCTYLFVGLELRLDFYWVCPVQLPHDATYRSWFHHAQLPSLASSFVLMIHQEKERNALKIGAMNLGWGWGHRNCVGDPKKGSQGGRQWHCRVHRDGSLSNLCKSVVVSVSPIAWLGPRIWKWSQRKRSRKKNSSKCPGHFYWQLKRYQRYRSNSRSRQEIWVILHHFWVPFWVPTCHPDPNVST